MAFFPDAIGGILEGRRVNMGMLVEFQFASGTERVWTGVRDLTSGGFTWFGIGKLNARVGGLQDTLSDESSDIELSVSGADLTDSIAVKALSEDRSEYIGRLVRLWLQFFDDEFQNLDSPYPFKAGLMDAPEIDRVPNQGGGWTRTIRITASNIFYGRSSPKYAFWTDADQQQRFPGDKGLERVPELQRKVIHQPW